MSRVQVDERKWPDQLHWQYKAQRLGEDEHGVWLHVPRGTIANRGHQPPMAVPYGFVTMVPDDEWWLGEFYWDNPKHSIYVNIGTPPQWHGDRVTQVDLDLDVILRPDGTVDTVDEDEFLDHQVRFDYPQDVIGSARAATARAAELLTARIEPFGVASQRWLDLANST